MKRETLFLKLAVILMSIPVLALCIFVVPEIGNFIVELVPNHSYLKILVYFDLYGTAIPFFIALYQALRLLSDIDQNKAFSASSVSALQRIKYCAISISSLYVLGLPLFYVMAEFDDAPGIIVIGMIMIFASLVVAVFAAVLQKLLQHAIDMKSELDLTV
jgi:hypothetical protein